MALDEAMPHVKKYYESWVGDDGNHVMVPNLSEIISITTPMTRVKCTSAKTMKC
jgi:hypothetical protein